MNKHETLINHLEIEPLSDGALELVGGGGGDTSGFPYCCSCEQCSMGPLPGDLSADKHWRWKQRRKHVIDNKTQLWLKDLEIEPLSDEALSLVSGADDTSGFPGCCSCTACSMWPRDCSA